MLVFGGSEGGLSTTELAALLASHGHPVARLDSARTAFPHQSLAYEGAGHGVGFAIPYLPAAR